MKTIPAIRLCPHGLVLSALTLLLATSFAAQSHVPYASIQAALEKEYGSDVPDPDTAPILGAGLLCLAPNGFSADVVGFGIAGESGTTAGLLCFRGDSDGNWTRRDQPKFYRPPVSDRAQIYVDREQWGAGGDRYTSTVMASPRVEFPHVYVPPTTVDIRSEYKLLTPQVAILRDSRFSIMTDFEKYINTPRGRDFHNYHSDLYIHGVRGDLNDAFKKVAQEGRRPEVIVAPFGKRGGVLEVADVHFLGGRLGGAKVVDVLEPLRGHTFGRADGFSGGYPAGVVGSRRHDIFIGSWKSYGSIGGPGGASIIGGTYSHDRLGIIPWIDLAVGFSVPRVVTYRNNDTLFGWKFTVPFELPKPIQNDWNITR